MTTPTTPLATVAEETSISVPTASETGIRRALTSEAEMVMPSVSSAENFANVPVATVAPAVGSEDISVATAPPAPPSATMPVATARSAPGSAIL